MGPDSDVSIDHLLSTCSYDSPCSYPSFLFRLLTPAPSLVVVCYCLWH